MDFRVLFWKRLWKITVFGLKSGARIWRTGRHTLTKNSQEYPPPPENLLLLHLFNKRANISEPRLVKLECAKRLIKGARAAEGACFPSRLENWLIIMHQGANVFKRGETKYWRAIREDQSTNPSSQHLKLIWIPKKGSNSVLLYLWIDSIWTELKWSEYQHYSADLFS